MRSVADHTREHAKLGLQTSGGAYLWADRPSAVGRAGDIIFITNIGPNGTGSYWYSDGVRWRLVNNASVVYNMESDLTLVAGLTTPQLWAQMTLPAGVLSQRDLLVITLGATKSPTAGTMTHAYYVGAGGSTPWVSDAVLFSNTPGFTNQGFGAKTEVERTSATTLRNRGVSAVNQFPGGSTISGLVVTVQNMDSQVLVLSLVTTFSTINDSGTIRSGTVELLTCGS